MKSLTEIGLETGTDKATYHGYTEHYERHLSELRDKPCLLVEIGVASGASIRMWEKWFTGEAFIAGIDIDPNCYFDTGNPNSEIFIADGTRDTCGFHDVDVVIDDGSHTADDIMRAFNLWWPRLVSGGWYVIEDLAVQWRRDYGGRPTSGSMVTDVIGAWGNALMKGDSKNDSELHIYDEIVFLRKK